MCPAGNKANSALHKDQFRGGKHFENTAVHTKLPFKHITQRALLSSCHYNHFEQFYGQKSGNVTNQKLGVRHSITYLVLVMAHRGFLGFLNVGYEYI